MLFRSEEVRHPGVIEYTGRFDSTTAASRGGAGVPSVARSAATALARSAVLTSIRPRDGGGPADSRATLSCGSGNPNGRLTNGCGPGRGARSRRGGGRTGDDRPRRTPTGPAGLEDDRIRPAREHSASDDATSATRSARSVGDTRSTSVRPSTRRSALWICRSDRPVAASRPSRPGRQADRDRSAVAAAARAFRRANGRPAVPPVSTSEIDRGVRASDSKQIHSSGCERFDAPPRSAARGSDRPRRTTARWKSSNDVQANLEPCPTVTWHWRSGTRALFGAARACPSRCRGVTRIAHDLSPDDSRSSRRSLGGVAVRITVHRATGTSPRGGRAGRPPPGP